MAGASWLVGVLRIQWLMRAGETGMVIGRLYVLEDSDCHGLLGRGEAWEW